jgi:acyl carrier protein phosphodiesterase
VNHLAHLFLAAPGAESLIGNFAGDFVKGPLGERFTPGVRAGIQQHRAIDAYTDALPATAAFRRVLIPEHGHYARVIADMFFDHFLASHFDDFAGERLESFLRRTFATLDAHEQLIPSPLRELYPRIRDEGWLPSYRDVDGIRFALGRMSWRFKRRPDLASSARHLVDSRAELQPLFETLFRDVMAYSRVRFGP